MSLTGTHHVSFRVSDVERALVFYKNLLGLEQVPKPPYLGKGAWLVGVNGQPRIHLTTGGPTTPAPPGPIDPRASHVCFQVEDYQRLKKDLVDAGIQVYELQHQPDTELELFFRDPDGYLLEVRTLPIH